MSIEEIDRRFGFHPARPGTDEGVACANLRYEFRMFARALDAEIPEGREKALALTALQEAAMWGQAALAMERPLEGDGG